MAYNARVGTIDVIINGERRAVPEGQRVSELLALLELIPQRVAIEINERLVPRGSHGDVALAAGDRVEIVTLVGGG